MLLAVKVAMEAVAAEVASLVVARWAELEAAKRAVEAAVQRVVCSAAVDAETHGARPAQTTAPAASARSVCRIPRSQDEHAKQGSCNILIDSKLKKTFL